MEGKMFENIPEMIKKSYIITICISAISLVTGILLQREEIYLGFFTGSLISLLNTYLLISGTYKILHVKLNGKIAGTLEFIKRMPEGIDTVIGENGERLSGGERQRLSIARAILKDAPVILLDEATASLDVENESLIQEALSELIKKKTVIIIAHRMRTIRSVDKIVLLNEGKIEAVGNDEELYEKSEMYRNMVDKAMA